VLCRNRVTRNHGDQSYNQNYRNYNQWHYTDWHKSKGTSKGKGKNKDLCQFFLAGNCRFGDSCNRSHGDNKPIAGVENAAPNAKAKAKPKAKPQPSQESQVNQ
jgi:hypothetical protein